MQLCLYIHLLLSLFLIPTTIATFQIPIHSSTAIISLQQTLALYPLAIDSKNFSALSHVFSKNVIANYSAPLGVLTGLEAVMTVLEESLAPVTSQHALSTFAVVSLGESNAQSITYYTASHFGKGASTGQVLYAYGQYVDNWVIEGGAWKIARRQLNYMGPGIGNVSIFE